MYNKQKWSMNEHGFSTSHIISKKERKSRKRHKFKLMKPWKNIMTFQFGWETYKEPTKKERKRTKPHSTKTIYMPHHHLKSNKGTL